MPKGFTAEKFKNVLTNNDDGLFTNKLHISYLTDAFLVPIFDSREHIFNFASDLDNLNQLPMYVGEIPAGSCVVVGYSLGCYEAVKDNVNRSYLTTNILFAIVLATE